MGKGARGSGPRERMVPLINGAGVTLRWFIEDVWCCFDDDHARPGAPLFCSERRNIDGTAARVGNETLRSALASAAGVHLPGWPERVTPHVLRHFCASQLYLGGMDLIAIQQALGHAWIATTMNYIHEPSGIASAARETAGQQVSMGPHCDPPPHPVRPLTRGDRRPSPSDARTSRQRGKINDQPDVPTAASWAPGDRPKASAKGAVIDSATMIN
jgi:hypothetical protein